MGLTQSVISRLLSAKSTRDELGMIFDSNISTQTLVDISPLPKSHQVKVLRKVKDIDKSQINNLSKKIEEN